MTTTTVHERPHLNLEAGDPGAQLRRRLDQLVDLRETCSDDRIDPSSHRDFGLPAVATTLRPPRRGSAPVSNLQTKQSPTA
jgi:hypothetical protein